MRSSTTWRDTWRLRSSSRASVGSSGSGLIGQYQCGITCTPHWLNEGVRRTGILAAGECRENGHLKRQLAPGLGDPDARARSRVDLGDGGLGQRSGIGLRRRLGRRSGRGLTLLETSGNRRRRADRVLTAVTLRLQNSWDQCQNGTQEEPLHDASPIKLGRGSQDDRGKPLKTFCVFVSRHCHPQIGWHNCKSIGDPSRLPGGR